LYPDFFDLVVEGEILQVDLDQKSIHIFSSSILLLLEEF
jgi:hypothetical protein